MDNPFYSEPQGIYGPEFTYQEVPPDSHEARPSITQWFTAVKATAAVAASIAIFVGVPGSASSELTIRPIYPLHDIASSPRGVMTPAMEARAQFVQRTFVPRPHPEDDEPLPDYDL